MNFMKTIINSIKYWVNRQLENKVDIEEGKMLSSNDYTTEEKEKLASIEADATRTTVNGMTGDVVIEFPEINYPVTSVNGQTGDVVIEVSSGSSVQADMAQNDPDQPDYVKNRTHWVEGSFEEILPETELNFAEQTGMYMGSTTVDHTKIVDGQTYTMVWDGTEYNAESFIVSSVYPDGVTTYEAVCIGNPKFIGKEDNGIPFYGTNMNSGMETVTDEFYVVTDSTETTHTLSISAGSATYHPLDEAFIPDTIARKSDIPEVNYPVTSVNGVTGDITIDVPTDDHINELIDAKLADFALPSAEEVAF